MRHILRNALLSLTAVGAFASLAVPASAAKLPTFAGFVSPSGVVSGISGFTGVHTGTGAYTITAKQSMFHGFPVMTPTTFGINGAIPIINLFGEVCGSGTCTFKVLIFSLAGAAMDNGWVFTVIQT
jgi:hypothetical protein